MSSSLEPLISKIAYDKIEEKPGYTGKRVTLVNGHEVICLALVDGELKINGVPGKLEDVPKKVDKVILNP